MKPPNDQIPFMERVMRFQDGQLSTRELSDMEHEMQVSPEKRRLFRDAQLRSMLIHETLRREAYATETPTGSSRALLQSRHRMAHSWVAVPCLAVALAIAILWIFGMGPNDASTDAGTWSVGYVATLVGQNDCVWVGDATFRTGQRLLAGRLQLQQGQALVNFDSGARLAVAAPAELIVESPGAARVLSGRVAVQVVEEAVGFRLATAQGTAVDLGTEFIVSVDDEGVAQCSVIDGVVEWHFFDGQRGKIQRLSEGDSRRFHDGKTAPTGSLDLNFADFIPAPQGEITEELLAYEPFDYSSTVQPVDQLDGGFGWRSTWRGRFVPTDKIDVDPVMELDPERNLAFPGLAAGRGGSLRNATRRHYRLRALPRPIDFSADAVHYFSFLMLAQDWSVKAPMRIEFRSTDDYWNQSIGWSLGTSFRPFILANGINSSGGVPLTPGETVFVVGKISTSRHNPDQIFMRVYLRQEEPEAAETSQWTAVTRDLRLDCSLDYLIFAVPRSEGGRFDELRYGTSWRAVVPLATADKEPKEHD